MILDINTLASSSPEGEEETTPSSLLDNGDEGTETPETKEEEPKEEGV